MRAWWTVARHPYAVGAGRGRAQLDIRAGVPEQALDEQDIVLVIVDVKHDAAHDADGVRVAGPARAVVPGRDGVQQSAELVQVQGGLVR